MGMGVGVGVVRESRTNTKLKSTKNVYIHVDSLYIDKLTWVTIKWLYSETRA